MVQPQLVTLFDGDDQPAIVSLMTEAEALNAERDIITTGNRLRALLVEFYERRGWAALGYTSWRGWAAAKLGQSENMAYRELLAGQVERHLFDDSQKIGLVPETHLRPLAPLRDDPDALRETWGRANELAEEEGKPRTARHVEAAVAERSAGDELADEPLTPYEEQVAAHYVAPAPMAVHFSSATPEWYTPRHIVERVLLVFGQIDLDPCSNAKGDEASVPARAHFTRDDDGLSQSWRLPSYTDDHGEETHAVRVYMNPPYGDEIGQWVARMVDAYETGEITEAIALLPARVDTAWWRRLRAYAVCFVAGRLKFSGADNSAPFPSAIVYLGRDRDGFLEAFGAIGEVRPAAL